ncbi:proline-rich family protein [Perilla frutescens var. hirtella]|nr:proline-rich family protein [Perilla frutescens var. hirtella]KAH6807635.1 proline-rich family protein [Perilla frutescens var. frutescens]
MVKTTKGGKTMNPTDAYRKELRKKELKRNKKERKKVREVGILKKDPDTLKDQIQKLESMKADGALDKARKHKKRQLEDTLNLVLKKRKYGKRLKTVTVTTYRSHLGPVRRRATAEEEERVKHPQPEDSVYYHPTLNPSGAPPPGKPPMFKSSIGPRIPLPEASANNVASSSMSETEENNLPVPPPPPPLPGAGLDSGEGAALPVSLPLPPPPPMPPKPAVGDITSSLPPPPPPPGPPPKELLAVRPPLPPPPPIQPSAQPPPPGTVIDEDARSDDSTPRHPVQMPTSLPPQPPPIGLPPKLGNTQPEGSSSESDAKTPVDPKDLLKMAPPPPPLRQQPQMPGSAIGANFPLDVLPPGISRFPPPPPPPPTDMRPPMSAPGIPGQHVHPGLMAPLLPRPPFGPPLAHPSMIRPPLPPGPPPIPQDDPFARPAPPQKPSYIKSAASTVVKRPLAQHTPELTAMVPASVRVRRESVLPKAKPKTSTLSTPNRPIVAPPVAKQESIGSSSAPKPQKSIDDSYMAFLEDMKALGALDS